MSVVLASDPTDDTHTSGGRFSFRGRGLGLGLGLGRRGGTDFSALQAKSDAKDLQVRALLNDFNAQQEMTAAKVKQVEEKVIGLGAGGGGDGGDLGGAVEVAQTVGGLGDAQYQAFLAAWLPSRRPSPTDSPAESPTWRRRTRASRETSKL